MLTHLTISNLAVVESASLELSPGLNVLTGETGAGKSVIVDALALLRGGARSRARVRDGASSALVEAQIVPSSELLERLAPIFERYDLKLEEEIIVSRRIETSGRTRSYVQGRLVPLSVLAELGEELVEICGQHESHAMRTPGAQLAALDRFGDLDALAGRFHEAYAKYRAAAERATSLRARQAELEKRRDFLEYQLEELGRVDLDDYAEARARLPLVRGASELRELCALVEETLSEGDDSLQSRLSFLSRRTNVAANAVRAHAGQDAPESDDLLGPLRDALGVVDDALEAASRQASLLASRTAFEPGELPELERRIDETERLAQKHRCQPEELARFKEKLALELGELSSVEAELPDLERAVTELERRAEKLAGELHEARRRAAKALGKAVHGELDALCLPGALLEVLVERTALGPQGASSVELSFRPNPGQASAPLGRIASGGELSRVLLALRVASRHMGGFAVFDEIDAGAGGHVAERIGERLRRASRSGQVLCVTHWPQVAAHADAHFLVRKHSKENTTSHVTRLDGAPRVDELSRMLGGSLLSARSHAADLLAAARAAEERGAMTAKVRAA